VCGGGREGVAAEGVEGRGEGARGRTLHRHRWGGGAELCDGRSQQKRRLFRLSVAPNRRRASTVGRKEADSLRKSPPEGEGRPTKSATVTEVRKGGGRPTVVNRTQGRCLSFDSKVGIGGRSADCAASADCSGGPRRAGGALQRAAEERRPRRTHAGQCGRRRSSATVAAKGGGFRNRRGVEGEAAAVRRPPRTAAHWG
jgi:hypothetical protein